MGDLPSNISGFVSLSCSVAFQDSAAIWSQFQIENIWKAWNFLQNKEFNSKYCGFLNAV